MSVVAASALSLCMFLTSPAQAIMAGDANVNPPDRPELRVDPNLASSPWAGVGSLSINGGTYSGVAIGPRHVLTAAHVVSGIPPSNIIFNVNYGGALAYRIPAAATFVHPGYGKNQSGLINLDDIAVVALASDLPRGVPYYPLLSEPLEIGTVITLVGYGASGDGVNGATVASSPAIKRVGRNVIDLFLPAVKRFEFPRAYLFDFDDPLGKTHQLGGASLGNRIETMIASGDSGSPAFVDVEGQWEVAGINTFQIGDPARGSVPPRFGSLGGGMWIPAYTQWVTDTMMMSRLPEANAGYLWMVGLVGLFGMSQLRKWR